MPRIVFAAAFAALISTSAASGETITVCAEGCDHTTIGAAVDAANDGDVIQVGVGAFTEPGRLLEAPTGLVIRGTLTKAGELGTFVAGLRLRGEFSLVRLHLAESKFRFVPNGGAQIYQINECEIMTNADVDPEIIRASNGGYPPFPRLEISDTTITVTGDAPAGVFYTIQCDRTDVHLVRSRMTGSANSPATFFCNGVYNDEEPASVTFEDSSFERCRSFVFLNANFTSARCEYRRPFEHSVFNPFEGIFTALQCSCGTGDEWLFDNCSFRDLGVLDDSVDEFGFATIYSGGPVAGLRGPVFEECHFYTDATRRLLFGGSQLVGCVFESCCPFFAGVSSDWQDGGLNIFGSNAYLACPECRCDLDCDGTVGAADLGALLGAWGSSNPNGDIDENGIVRSPDLGLLIAAWGECR